MASSLNEPFGIAVDSTNGRLYAANVFAPAVNTYSIGSGTGLLSELSASPDTTLLGPYAVAIYPGGQYIYITDTSTTPGTVNVVTIDNTGVLTMVHSYAVGTTPKGIAIDPTGKFLYVSNTGDGTVSAFTINSGGGALTGGVTGSPFTASGAASTLPTALAVDSSSRFLYVANGDDGTISVFKITAGGVLTAVGSPVPCAIVLPHSGVGPQAIVVQ